MSKTATSTSAAPPDTSAPISTWNILNLVAYLANVGVTYSVGLFGLLGRGNNAEISARYQTLITPANWAFSIWGVIFTAQLIWAVLQIALPKYRVKAMQYVSNYNYILVCLAQIGWTFAFAYEIIWLSMIFMTLILVFLVRIVKKSRQIQAQHHEKDWYEEYAALVFPFTIHAGWVIAATLLNANILLVANKVSSNTEFIGAFVSVVLAFLASSVFLAQPDFIIPLTLIWALTGIYVKLGDPKVSTSFKFSGRSLSLVQKATGTAIIAITVALLLRLYTTWKECHKSHGTDDNSSSLKEPLNPSGGKESHNHPGGKESHHKSTKHTLSSTYPSRM